MNSDSKELFYLSSNGHKVHYQPISIVELNLARAGLEREYRERGEPLDPPTYEVVFAGGEKQTFPHDATTLDKRGDPEANRKAWFAYQSALVRKELEEAELVNTIILEDGVIEPLPEDTAWIERQKRRHIAVPEDPEARRIHWLTTVALPTSQDIKNLIVEVYAVSSAGMVGEEELNAALDTFRHNVSGKRKGKATGPANHPGALAEKPLDAQRQAE